LTPLFAEYMLNTTVTSLPKLYIMTKKIPHILIVNDDGIFAPGIRHLYKSLQNIARLTVVAPMVEQSGVGLSITIRNPLRVHSVEWPETQGDIYSVNGTPADCVKIALNVVLDSPPDLVVSGINRGTNAGRNLLYSGTVGGVIESVLQGIPGIAFSCREYKNTPYELVESYVPKIVEYVLNHTLPPGTLLNVNFPETAKGIKGFRMTRQGLEFWGENFDRRMHPAEEHPYYWMGAKLLQFEEHEDSDIAWLRKGYITAVPVHINELTDHTHLNARKKHFEEFLDV